MLKLFVLCVGLWLALSVAWTLIWMLIQNRINPVDDQD
jgi:hypothetical protein